MVSGAATRATRQTRSTRLWIRSIATTSASSGFSGAGRAWIPSSPRRFPTSSPSNDFRATPLMLGGVLYTSNSVGLVEALDPGTGETLWIQEPIHEGFRGVAGRSTRGVAHWSSGSNQRVFSVQGDYLVSMSAETGSLDRGFGDGGKVDLTRDASTTTPFPDGGTSGPIVVGRRGHRRRRGRR